MIFTNEAKRRGRPSHLRASSYGFDKAPNLLFQWSRLFQAVISQAGTYLLKQRFHTSDCGIYKCEGGCRIDGRGELVLTSDVCYWNYEGRTGKDESDAIKMADLITAVVLEWEPTDPIDSMIRSAANHVGCKPGELKNAVEGSTCGGVFGGDSLSAFFDWNPFGDPPRDRAYQRWCLVKINGQSEAEVDQKFADEDLGKSLLNRIQDAARNRNIGRHGIYPLCCSPRRDGKKLSFWINTGCSTQLDGWKQESEIEQWIASGEPLIDERN